MKRFLICLILCISMADARVIKVNEVQEKELGVQTQKALPVEKITLPPFNATVVLASKDHITITPRLNGVVEDLYVKRFDNVAKGAKLFSLRSKELLELQQEYLSLFVEYQNKLQNYQRDTKLYETGLIAQKRLLFAKQEMLQSKLLFESLQTKLLESGFDKKMLQEVQESFSAMRVIHYYAPKNGQIFAINVNVGKSVSYNDAIVELHTQTQRYIEFELPLEFLELLSLGDVCTFEGYRAKVVAMSEFVNEETQSASVRALIENPEGIKVHTIYQVNIEVQVQKKLFKLVKSALVFSKGDAYIFKKVADGFEVLKVKIVSEDATHYTVDAALFHTDEIAVRSTVALLSAMEEADE